MKKDRGLKDRSIETTVYRLTRLFGPTIDQPIATITPAKAKELYLGFTGGVDSRMNTLAEAKTFFQFARARGITLVHPLEGVKGEGRRHYGKAKLSCDEATGGGIDVLLSAKRVGPTGKAYGLDMTDEMLGLARENQRKAGVENVEFLKGEIENIPLPDNAVDVIISNCVINLSADKDRVLREAFRVLKPGGRFAVSDIVVRGEVPAEIRRNVELWVGCMAGALEESEYLAKLTRAGFEVASIEPTRIYRVEDARELLSSKGIDVDAIAPLVDGKFMSAFVRARKPSLAS